MCFSLSIEKKKDSSIYLSNQKPLCLFMQTTNPNASENR